MQKQFRLFLLSLVMLTQVFLAPGSVQAQTLNEELYSGMPVCLPDRYEGSISACPGNTSAAYALNFVREKLSVIIP
jgi:hypothetical protein